MTMPCARLVTRKATTFLILTFIFSWAAMVPAWLNRRSDAASAGLSTLIFTFGPALAALACALAFEHGRRLESLGMRFKANWWLLWALLIPIAITALSIAITATFSPYNLAGIDGMAQQLVELHHEGLVEPGRAPSKPALFLIVSAGQIGLAIGANSVFSTLTEELGWRGYLYHLWRPFGFWRCSLATGLAWGLWHWPMIYLFGLNYPEHQVLGLALFPMFTMLEAPIFTLLRDRGHSVWPAGICHGTINAVFILTMAAVVAPKFPWDTTGIGTVAAVSIATLLIAVVRKRTAADNVCEPDDDLASLSAHTPRDA